MVRVVGLSGSGAVPPLKQARTRGWGWVVWLWCRWSGSVGCAAGWARSYCLVVVRRYDIVVASTSRERRGGGGLLRGQGESTLSSMQRGQRSVLLRGTEQRPR